MPDVTPAQLSLELGISQKRIRDFLRSQFGILPSDEARWQLDEDKADLVRERFRNLDFQGSATWTLEPGDTVRRRTIHEAYGGQRQGGISTPRSLPEIFIFTNPDSGAAYGYDRFEGLKEDGSYAYTGEGQYGAQVFERGNRALRDANGDGKIIRLLRTRGVDATYVGAFITDNPPYGVETIPDANGEPRRGIIFNLLPLEARTDLLPAYGGDLAADQALVSYSSHPREWTPPEYSDVVLPGTETVQGDRVVSRVEFELQSDFGAWLKNAGTPPKRLPLRAGATLIHPDFFVPARSWIVEAKPSIARGHIRGAIGQVLDYVHIAAKAGLETTPVVLLPGRPERDLLELMGNLGITVVTRADDEFEVITSWIRGSVEAADAASNRTAGRSGSAQSSR